MLKAIRCGDKLVVWKIDRLVRNMRKSSEIVDLFKKRGVSLEIVDQKIYTPTPSGTAFLQMLGVLAEFETNIRAERQAIGIAKAKAEGKYKGKRANLAKHAEVKAIWKKNTRLARS